VLNYKKIDKHFVLGERMKIPNEYLNVIKKRFPEICDDMFDNITEGFVSDLSDDLICLCKPTNSGDIESLGFKGTNNYREMWSQKDVYDENIKFNTLKYFYF
jgi:hypothetical protein